ncbi:uncharacterized protein LOC131030777 [Cryptomeria japonica]|uniref:uncharacterized protein LOC131030777 n=1 Tax=Cryptomeria japonica TaxID=3369 RepID=UPI0027D9F003|nr:uncharacterized protein LOC131030777 [Cryptomeria japonica]
MERVHSNERDGEAKKPRIPIHRTLMSDAAFVVDPVYICIVLLSAAIIMDRNSSAPYINNNYALNQHHGGQNIEQLKQLLLQLDEARYSLDVNNQILETKLLRLQELVVVMRRERDEAVQQRDEALNQLYILKQQLTQQTQQSNIISKPMWANKPIGSSPLGLDSVPQEGSSRSLIVDEVDWDWPQPVHRFDFTTDPQDNFHQTPTSSSIDHMIDRSNLADKQPVFDLPENEQQQEEQKDDLSFLKQDDPECQQHEPVDHSSLRLVENHDLWHKETHAVRQTTSLCMPEASSCMAYNNHQPQTARILRPPIDSNGSVPAMPLHLPEPPEADPDVMLSTLPERGKFLEAVMKAGPLLNTLLLAGPLPQWRHPPPALETVEIPMLSMRSSVSPSLGHMQAPHMTSSDPLPVTSPISSSHHNTSLDIKDPQQLQSSTLSKFLCWPSMNSQDSAMIGSPMKFAKIH